MILLMSLPASVVTCTSVIAVLMVIILPLWHAAKNKHTFVDRYGNRITDQSTIDKLIEENQKDPLY